MKMKKGFTLVELLAVIGLMGLMGAMAIGGYSAVVRGMSDRAALDAAKGLVDAARQRANLDRKKVHVYLFNEVLKLDSDMSAGIASGVAIAVRPVGRVSAIRDNLICDEFGDLNGTYASLDSETSDSSSSGVSSGGATTRLYNMRTGNFAIVKDGVFLTSPHSNRTLETPESESSSSSSASEDSGIEGEDWKDRDFSYYGFEKVDGDADFRAGEEYGQEFAVARLPPGYVFSQSVTMSGASSLGQQQVGTPLVISPDATSSPSITVYRRRPDGQFESIGSTSQVKDGE